MARNTTCLLIIFIHSGAFRVEGERELEDANRTGRAGDMVVSEKMSIF
jgi:hypothetical protein